MNAYDERNMQGRSVISDRCVFCGRISTEQHHVVPRSRGGAKGPTLAVCGFGNACGCHGLLHRHRLHVRWANGWWEWLLTDIPCKQEKAENMLGWRTMRRPMAMETYGRGVLC